MENNKRYLDPLNSFNYNQKTFYIYTVIHRRDLPITAIKNCMFPLHTAFVLGLSKPFNNLNLAL